MKIQNSKDFLPENFLVEYPDRPASSHRLRDVSEKDICYWVSNNIPWSSDGKKWNFFRNNK